MTDAGSFDSREAVQQRLAECYQPPARLFHVNGRAVLEDKLLSLSFDTVRSAFAIQSTTWLSVA